MTLRASNQVLCNVWSYDFYTTSYDKNYYQLKLAYHSDKEMENISYAELIGSPKL